MKPIVTLSKIKFRFSKEATCIALTADIWTSCASDSYLGVTAHYLSEVFDPIQITLGIHHFPGAHTGEAIADFLKEIILKWDIKEQVTIHEKFDLYQTNTIIKDYCNHN